MNLAEVARVSKALADPTRLKIYEKIACCPDTFCGTLVEELGLSPATISHHLKVLADANLIEMRREGQFVHSCALLATLQQYTRSLAGLVEGKKPKRKGRAAETLKP
jgi:ArsR family transcriptional regulator, arsenate/arsenite/antimonite-responsive transcriptional repressor